MTIASARAIFKTLCDFCANHTKLVLALTAGSICASGDILSQTFEAYQDVKKARELKIIPYTKDVSIWEQTKHEFRMRFDPVRLSAVAVFGFCVSGPLGSLWYPILDKFMRVKFPHFKEGSFRFVATKVMFEQAIYGPLLTLLFFPTVSLIEGGDSLRTLPQRMKNDFWQTLLVDELAFTLIAPITYKYIPINFQLIWTSTVSVFENMFFSWVQHQGFPTIDLPGFPWGSSESHHKETQCMISASLLQSDPQLSTHGNPNADADIPSLSGLSSLTPENIENAPCHLFRLKDITSPTKVTHASS